MQYIYSIPVWPLETLFHNFFYTCDKCTSLYNLIEKWGSVQRKRKELKPLTGQQQVNTSLSSCVNMDMAKSDKDTTESQSRRQTSSCWFGLAMSSLPHTQVALHACYHSHRCISPLHLPDTYCPAACITIATQTATDVSPHTHKYTHKWLGNGHWLFLSWNQWQHTMFLPSTHNQCMCDAAGIKYLGKQWLALGISELWVIKIRPLPPKVHTQTPPRPTVPFIISTEEQNRAHW